MTKGFWSKEVPVQGESMTGANYDLAKAEADKVDAQIIETLKTGHSFRVEAGAGSGKTYSLNRVIEWIQSNKWSDYSRKKQNVVCITYTNAAVDVIAERLAKDSFILPSTIHSFAWNAIKQYQSVLIVLLQLTLIFYRMRAILIGYRSCIYFGTSLQRKWYSVPLSRRCSKTILPTFR